MNSQGSGFEFKIDAKFLAELSVNAPFITTFFASIFLNTYTIKLKKEIDIITPGLNIILDNPYIIEVERVVYYET